MSSPKTNTKKSVSPERLAEAGVWIARLHGDTRSRATESGFRRWLEAHPENERAFELATEVWVESEGLRRFAPPIPSMARKPGPRWHRAFAAAAMATVLLIVGVIWFQSWGVIATAVGEQRQLVLDDGTRVFLNTDTQLVVKYSKEERRVELLQGEALFNVAKRSSWPFIVVAGERQVKALGTSFVVRRDERRLAVTLVEGKIVVSPVIAAEDSIGADDAPEQSASNAGSVASSPQPKIAAGQTETGSSKDVFTLTPGQRLTFGAGSAAKLDTPSVEKTIAWRRGQVILDDTTVRTAAEEMNRYNSIKLVVADDVPAQLLISGLFQAGDSIRFAMAVAHIYNLNVEERDDQIILSTKPPR
jgi:transmembrane sensor